MMYILAFLLGCGIFWFAYEVGKTIGGTQSLQELERLRAANACAQRSLDFVNAELDHVRGLLNDKVATAHVNSPADTGRIDKYLTSDVTWHLSDAARAQMYCFHGISLSDHCGRCAQQNFKVGGIVN